MTNLSAHSKRIKKMATAILCSGYLITIFGIFGNSLSLYYFISQATSNSQPRNTDTSTTNLFVMLNCFDLMVCTFGFVLLFITWGDQRILRLGLNMICLISIELTYFITSLLSFRRLVNLYWPLYLVRRKTLNISIVFFSFITIAIELSSFISILRSKNLVGYVDKIRCIAYISLIAIIISSSLTSLIKL